MSTPELFIVLSLLASSIFPLPLAAQGTRGRVFTVPAVSGDSTRAIEDIIDASTTGSTIRFAVPGATLEISRTIRLRPDRTYEGGATIRLSRAARDSTTMFKLLNGDADNVTIRDLVFDASGKGGILALGVDGSEVPVTGLAIRNCVFRNSKATEFWFNSIYAPAGLKNAVIGNNRFEKTGGISVTDTSNVEITGNTFKDVIGNAVTITLYNRGNSGVQVTKNTGTGLTRMALEVFAGDKAGRGELTKLSVTDNTFTDWAQNTAHDAFGFSFAMRGAGTYAANNTLTGNDRWYGIEVAAEGMTIENNVITGFGTGIILQGQPNTTVRGNRIVRPTTNGILFANVNQGSPNSTILNNRIEDAGRAGIGAAPNNYGNSTIEGNIITRKVGMYPGDSQKDAEFIGIKLDAGVNGPVRIHNNTVTQTGTEPPPGFPFWGIGIFSSFPGTVFTSNRFESLSTRPFGTAFTVWTAGLLDGRTISDNTFIRIARVSSGNTSAAVKRSNNRACKVGATDAHLVTSTTCP